MKLKQNSANFLRKLKEETIWGHTTHDHNNFYWQDSAAVLDAAIQANELTISQIKSRLAECAINDWDCTLQAAETAPLPPQFDLALVGRVQGALLNALYDLPGVAATRGLPLITALTEYGLGSDSASRLLKEIIDDHATANGRSVNSFRLDTVGGIDKRGQVAITEAQVAMGGWTHGARVPHAPHLVGGDFVAARAFVRMMQEASGKENPAVAIFVERGVGRYWQEMNDFRFLLAQIAPQFRLYVFGNGGAVYDRQRHVLSYYNERSGPPIPLDIIYTLADARRFLLPELEPLLEAIRDRAVLALPTMHPLVNNYHLVRALLFHADPRFAELFEAALALQQKDSAAQLLALAKEQTIPMSLVDAENQLNLELLGFPGAGSFGWREVLDSLRQNKGQAAILSEKWKKGLIVRTLLSPDLTAMSGGHGSQKMKDYLKEDLATAVELSLAGMDELRRDGRTAKPIIGVEPLIKHRSRQIEIFDFDNCGMIMNRKIEARQRFCPVYVRHQNDSSPQLMAAFSFYSEVESSGYKLGGPIYAVGAHSANQ